MIVCTDPLPNERVPISVARLWSCSAPATISEAEAAPPLTRTTSGLSLVGAPPRVAQTRGWAGWHGTRTGHRLVEQAARVVTEVDDIAHELVRRDLLVDVGDRLVQAFRRLLVERGDANVADVAA